MSDYTLPPVPPVPPSPHSPSVERKWTTRERHCIAAYGHACAEAARAPLLARIAELEAEAERERLAQLACDAESSCFDVEFNHLQDENGKLSVECDRLRAEVDALRNRCQQAHDAILSGEDDAELLARLDFWSAARKGEGSEG